MALQYPGLSPEEFKNSYLAEINRAERSGADPFTMNVLRRVAVPFAELFAELQRDGEREKSRHATVAAAAAVMTHFLLNTRVLNGSTSDMLDELMREISRRAIMVLAVEMGPAAGGRQ